MVNHPIGLEHQRKRKCNGFLIIVNVTENAAQQVARRAKTQTASWFWAGAEKAHGTALGAF
jgi:hypothetical protein